VSYTSGLIPLLRWFADRAPGLQQRRRGVMPRHFKVQVLCAVCRKQAALVELLPPGHSAGWPADRMSPKVRAWYEEERKKKPWWLRYDGVESGSGSGHPVGQDQAERIVAAFAEPLTYARVHDAGFYDDAGFCGPCGKPYCYQHWNVSSTGYGSCPDGHGKSLDPHWHPDDDYE
jgi:hypothetical protein